MLNLFIFLLFIFCSANGQIIERFDSFTPSEKTTPLYIAIFNAENGDSASLDLSSAENNLPIGFDWRSQLVLGSPLKNGSAGIAFNGTSNLIATPSGDVENEFDMGTSSFTAQVWFYYSGTHAKIVISDKQNGSSGAAGWMAEQRSGGVLRWYISDGTNNYSKDIGGFTAGNTHAGVVVDHAGGKIRYYRNGIKIDSVNITTLNTISNAYSFIVGRQADPVGYYDSTFYAVSLHKSVLTDRQILEDVYLADGWVSKNGNVTRENFAFAQTFWDTIGIPLSDATLGNNQVWQLAYKGKSSDATKTINAWIGSAAEAKSSVYTITAGTSFATNTVNWGDAFALSSDTLWFASASTADTVSVDDVVLSKAQNSTANGRFNGWLGY